MQTYSDEYIEHWAELYLDNKAISNLIVFETFLEHPQEIIDAVKFDKPMPLLGDDEFYPLLANQKKVQERVDLQIDAETIQEEMDKRFARQGHVVEMHGNKIIEKLQHREAPKKWKTNTRVKAGGAS